MEQLIQAIVVIGVILVAVLALVLVGARGLMYTCAPNEALIFSGMRRRNGDKVYGFRVIKGGTGFRIPLIERVDRLDLTNIVIDMTATNAYSKGGIPLSVQGVANVKIAGHEPLINHAIERFLGKTRAEITAVAKATLEGSLRGILATMTPEQVNEDKILFAERLVSEVEQDMTALGLVVDTMKIQNVQDEVKYLESMGRKRGAEVISKARVAESSAKADSDVRSAENLEREQKAAIEAQIQILKADGSKRLTDAQTRRAALVAEQNSEVSTLVAQAKAELLVQKARVEQTKQRLEADVIAPATAYALTMEANAKRDTSSIIEEGKARAQALRSLSETYKAAGPNARQILLSQKLEGLIRVISGMVPETHVEKLTMIDGNSGGSGGLSGTKLFSTLEQVKQIYGIDLVEKLKQLGTPELKAPPAKVAFQEPLAPVARPTKESTPEVEFKFDNQ
ncbi:MAG: flotillin family protein [Fimbriimonas sp.]